MFSELLSNICFFRTGFQEFFVCLSTGWKDLGMEQKYQILNKRDFNPLASFMVFTF